MNRYELKHNVVEKKKDYFILKLERILSLLNMRNEVFLFENQNIFRHPCIFEKIQKVPLALKILNNKEKEWLKKNKNGAIATDNIYIFIADTLSSLYNNFTTNKNIKRSISLTLEILAIKIILSPIYKDKQKNDLEAILEKLKSTKFSSVDEIYVLLGFENKLNPELNKFVKNWTRSITFDFKVKLTSLMIDIKHKLKKENKLQIDKITKENNTFLTREEMFENIAERLFECTLDNFWIEEFKFLSARLIYKNQSSYSKIILKKRAFDSEEEKEEFRDRLQHLLNSNNTYLSSDYLKYHMIFNKGLKYGMKKLVDLRGVDYTTARIIIDMFLMSSFKNYFEDKAYRNLTILYEELDSNIILYGFKPYDFVRYKLDKMKNHSKKEEHIILGDESLKEYIKGSLKFHFNTKREQVFNNLVEDADTINIQDFLNIFKEYSQKDETIRKEVSNIFMMIFAEYKNEFANKKKKPSIELDKQKNVLDTILLFIENNNK